MLTSRELATVLAALRFWQRHGPPHNPLRKPIDPEEQHFLSAISTGGGHWDPLSVAELDHLCVRLNASDVVDEPRCECELPGYFHSGVPGILARMEDGHLASGATVERCDLCRRYVTDAAARQKLIDLNLA